MTNITDALVAKARNMAAGACDARSAWHLRDEIEGAALEALAKADATWDGRGSFDAYAIHRASWACRDEFRRWRGRDAGSRSVREPIGYGVTEADLERFLAAYNWNGRP